jgi:hypothetical protein
MSQSEARAWWADVEEVRAIIERRRAAERRSVDDARGPDALADVDDLAVRRRFRGREHTAADAAADAWSDEPVPAARSAAAAGAPGHRSHVAPAGAARAAAPADRRAAMAALAPVAPLEAASAPRRTVQITGRTVPAPHVVPFDGDDAPRRRPVRASAALGGPRPDRIAMWAVVLGFVLIAVAAASAHGATGAARPAASAAPAAAPVVQHALAAPAAPLRPQRH